MLDRFPGIKWVVHNGWYNYNGRQFMGWYFSSIPAQTILPVSNSDLRMLTLVSGSSSEGYPDFPCPPSPPGPPSPPPPVPPGPWPGPHPPIWPPIPPGPEPDKPAYFSKKLKALYDAAFISVATLKKRDELDTETIPDGKIVRVNSVDGEPRYYIWSKYTDHWEDFDLVSAEQVEEIYQTVQQINDQVDIINQNLETTAAELGDKIDDLSDSVDADIAEINSTIESVQGDINSIRIDLDNYISQGEQDFDDVFERLGNLEDAVFDIEKLVELFSTNTILVSKDGTIADSGVGIGDDVIGEPSEYADVKTVATEKAVAKKVEDSIPKWEPI